MRYLRSLTLCLLGLVSPAVLIAQNDDGSFLERTIQDALSGAGREVRVTGFAGALSSTATLDSLTISDADGVWLTLTDAQLDWRRAALLRGRLELDSLTAASITLARLPTTDDPEAEEAGFQMPRLPPPEATQFALPELPVSIQIGEIRIDSVLIAEPVFGQEVEASLAGSASLADGEGEVDLNIERTDGQLGTLALAGSFANRTEILSVNLTMAEAENGVVATLLDVPERPSLDLSVLGEGPISDFIMSIGLRTDNVDRLIGRVEVGSTETQEDRTEQFFNVDLAGDITPLLQPEYRSFVGDDLSLEIAGVRSDQGGLDLNTLRLDAAELDLEGRVSLHPDAWPRRIDVQGRIAPVEGNSVLLSIPGPETRMSRASLNFAFDATESDAWLMSITADDVTREDFSLRSVLLGGQGTIRPGEGALVGRVLGQISARIAGLDLGDTALTKAVGSDLNGRFDFALQEDAPFQLRNLSLTGVDYGLDGDVTVLVPQDTPSPTIGGEITLSARDIARFADVAGQQLGGAVQIDVSGNVTPLDGAFDLEISGETNDLTVGVAQLDPLIAGDGALTVAARRDNLGTFVDRLSIRTPQSDIDGRVSLQSGATEGRIRAQIFDTSLIHPDMIGDGSVDVTFDQDGDVVNADLSLAGPGETTADVTLRTPEGAARTRFEAAIASQDLSVYAWAVGQPISGGVNLRAQGDADISERAVAAQLNGTITDLRTGIAEADILLAGVAEVVVDAARAANGAVSINTLSLNAPRLTALASGSVGGRQSEIDYSVRVANFGLIVPALPGEMASEGTVTSGGDQIGIDSTLTGPGGLQAAVQGTLRSDASRADMTIRGAAPLALANSRLAPNIIDGPLQFDLRINGPFDVASVSGTLATSGARMSIPAASIALQSIDSNVSISGGRAQVDVSLTPAATGQVRVTGPISLTDPFPGELAVALNEVIISRPGLIETSANGQLTVSGPLTGGARIAGQIDFGEIAVQVPSTSGAASAALPGLQHVNEPTAVRQTRARAGLIENGAADGRPQTPPFGLDVLLSAPSRIFIRGRGLDAEMGGRLRIGGTTNQIVPSGRFELVRGRLNILGQRVDLTEGYIQPQGDLDAYMRIVAEATSGDTDVRFTIEGQVSSPELTISSSPELPEDEVLSRFLFGRDLSEISTIQALQIADAIASLNGNGSGAFGRLRQGLGLDDLDVSTTETGETTVRAGRYLTENIYSDVSRTTDGETEINLNLTLTPNLTARGTARSDSTTGIGIFLERDY